MTFNVGQELEEVQVTLAASMVNDYISVVDDQSSIYAEAGLVPMTALAAIGLKTLLEGLGLPPGAIHIAQELAGCSPPAVAWFTRVLSYHQAGYVRIAVGMTDQRA